MTPPRFKAIERRGQSVLRMRPAWRSYWKYWLAMAAVTLLWILGRPLFEGLAEIFGLPASVSGLGLLIGLAPVAGKMFFHRYTHAYEIENGQKLRFVAGFISRVKREFPLTDKVQTDMGQSVIGRILNYGTIGFWTGDDRSRLVWKDVYDPDQVVAFLEQVRQGGFALAQETKRGSPRRRSVAPEMGEHSFPTAPTLNKARVTASARARTEKFSPRINSAASATPPLPHPPAGTIFADRTIFLPRFHPSLVRHIGSEFKSVVEPQQFVIKGEPLLTLTLMTEDETLFGGGKFADVVIPAPVCGLVLRRSHVARPYYDQAPPAPADEMRTAILPVKGEPVENGAFIYGELLDAMWKHRDFLFRNQRKLKEIAKHSAGSAQWVATWTDENTVRKALDELFAQHCDELPARPAFDDYLSEAWIKRPHLRGFLADFVDEATLRRVNANYNLEEPQMVDEAIRTHRATLEKLAVNN